MISKIVHFDRPSAQVEHTPEPKWSLIEVGWRRRELVQQDQTLRFYNM